MAVTISHQQDEITYQELIKFMHKKASKGMSSERLLAVASKLVGTYLAWWMIGAGFDIVITCGIIHYWNSWKETKWP